MVTPDLDRVIGTGVAAGELRADARSLPVDEFADRYGEGFLLLTAADLALSKATSASTDVRLADDHSKPGESTASLSLVVFPLRSAAASPARLVTIGRSEKSDVVIPDVSVSRLHAFARAGEASAWRLQDAGSTNGTTLNGRSVPQQGQGEAADLKAGDNVRLGQVELTFLDASALRGFLAKLER